MGKKNEKCINEPDLNIPKEILSFVANGKMSQWKKRPNIFFIKGIDRFQLIWSNGKLTQKYENEVVEKEQRARMNAIAKPLLSKYR